MKLRWALLLLFLLAALKGGRYGDEYAQRINPQRGTATLGAELPGCPGLVLGSSCGLLLP